MSTYASFQGRVYLGKRDAAGLPIEVRSPGNVAELKLSLKTDVLEHYESQTGQRTLDHRMVKQKSATVNLTIEEFTKENLALALYGNHVTGTPGHGDRRADRRRHAGGGRSLFPRPPQGRQPGGEGQQRHARSRWSPASTTPPRSTSARSSCCGSTMAARRRCPTWRRSRRAMPLARRPTSASSPRRCRSGTCGSKDSTPRRATPRCWSSCTGWPSIR